MEYKNINKCYSNDFMELYHCDCMELLKTKYMQPIAKHMQLIAYFLISVM